MFILHRKSRENNQFSHALREKKPFFCVTGRSYQMLWKMWFLFLSTSNNMQAHMLSHFPCFTIKPVHYREIEALSV